MQEYRYYVGGEFRKSSSLIEVINPATEKSFAKFFATPKEDVEFALEKSKIAQSQWRQTSYKERADILRQIAKTITDNLSTLAKLESQEIGKTFKESLFVDVPLGADCFNYYASLLDSLEEKSITSEYGIDLIKHEPYGVAGVYLPFNVPLMIFGFSCAAALAAGNALIIKPSEYGSLSILELAKYLNKLDIPKGLINIITGVGHEVGNFLAESKVDIISFTGSRNTLKKVMLRNSASPKKTICELGGCNLTTVFSDSDTKSAMENVLGSSFMKQGQMCIGTSLLLVEQNLYQDFIKELVNKAKAITIGDPFDSTVGMGPVVTKEHLLNVDKKVKDTLAKGGKLLTGGQIKEGKGYFYPPTIIEVKDICYEEFFAPVILVKSFKDEQELEKILEDNPTGLAAQIWTKDLDKANRLANKTNSGTVWINTFAQMNSQTSFGGMKESGWGRNLGRCGFYEYTQTKHIGIGIKKSPVEGWFGV